MSALEIQKMPETFHPKSTLAQHVMLVDGNLHQRHIFSELLKNKLRYKLTEAGSGQEALHHLTHYARDSSREVDIILLDLSTVENAFSLLSDLRRQMPGVPVVVIVQYGDYQSAADALLLGAQDFMTKPVAEARMNVTLRNCIQLRNANRDAISALGGHNPSYGSQNSHSAESVISFLNNNGEAKKIEEIEMAAIRFAIRFYNGRMTEVARKLGIGRSTLYRKLEIIGQL